MSCRNDNAAQDLLPRDTRAGGGVLRPAPLASSGKRARMPTVSKFDQTPPARPAPADPSDAELITAIAAGERDALGALYDRHAATIAAVGARFGMGLEAAEDIVHDVFLDVWASAYDYDPTRGTVVAWLVVRMRSRCLDGLRKTTRRSRLLEAAEEKLRPRELTPPSVRGIERNRLRGAIAQLDEDLQEVTRLAYFDGATTREIADDLGIAQGTVKSRMRRAREALLVLLTAGEET